MAQKRDTYLYNLKQGNKVVYIGITNDPERREKEHELEGKQFTKMIVARTPMTKGGAEEKENKKLDTYLKNQGKLPKYNK